MALCATLRDLAKKQIRRNCRTFGYDWQAFVADGPEWGITEIVHRRAVQQGCGRGLDLRPTDIPTDTVLAAVSDVIREWTEQPELRPTRDAFREEQARRGDLGRQTQQEEARRREAQVMALVAQGVTNNAEIGRRVRLDRSTVGRIRRKAAARPVPALHEADDAPAVERTFPAPDVPSCERWPAVQFMGQTGVYLDAADARWLCDMGRCYEAEGRERDLLRVITAIAGAGFRDSWAYLQRSVANRGDAWTAPAGLLADILKRAGQDRLQYALTAIGGGYVDRPLPYLQEVLRVAVASDRRPDAGPEKPVATAVAMARKWAPELVVVSADDMVAAEDVEQRRGYLESFRRRYGRMPGEQGLEEKIGAAAGDIEWCDGLDGVPGDDSDLIALNAQERESSPVPNKADAASAEHGPGDVLEETGGCFPAERPLQSGAVERGLKSADLPDSGEDRRPESAGEARDQGRVGHRPLPRQERSGILEQAPCRHPLAALLASRMNLDLVEPVECSSGCGHRLYSDRGPVECPCCWPAAKVARVAAALQPERACRAPAGDDPDVADASDDTPSGNGAVRPPQQTVLADGHPHAPNERCTKCSGGAACP